MGLLSFGIPPRWSEFKVVSPPTPHALKRWVCSWVITLKDKRTGELVEERRISIKLPIWGYYYSINFDDERWGQLSFQYCGRRGCFLAPIFRELLNA